MSFDVNHRATLWSDDEAAPVLARLAAAADLVFAGPEEAALLLGRTPAGAGDVRRRRGAGPRAGQAWARRPSWSSSARSVRWPCPATRSHRAPALPVAVVDPVGAGDAFVAGYLSEVVAGGPSPDASRTGNACGAAVCEVPGDWEGLPTRAELADRARTRRSCDDPFDRPRPELRRRTP